MFEVEAITVQCKHYGVRKSLRNDLLLFPVMVRQLNYQRIGCRRAKYGEQCLHIMFSLASLDTLYK